MTAVIAQAHAESVFEKYRIVQDRLFVSDFDREIKRPEEPHAEARRTRRKNTALVERIFGNADIRDILGVRL